MPTPAPDSLTGIPPLARDAVAKLTAAPTEPVKLLVSGGIGTGKSAVLTTVRSLLRDAARSVLTRPPRAGDDPHSAVVVDDAHLLTDDELGQLTDRVADPATTVVIGALPLAQREALRTLFTVLERENPVLTLGPWPGADVARMAAETLGAAPPPEIVRSLMAATAGLPFLLRPAVAAAASPGGEAPATAVLRAAGGALTERLRRLDEATLDTLLISSLSHDLGPDDVAAALRLSPGQAHAAVDHARATGLLEPSLRRPFPRTVHRCVAQILGTARHHDVEVSLLVTQLESSTLTTDLALQLAEHGLRDDRLASALAELASRGHHRPASAARLYRAAAEAGATAASVRLADALAQTGDCATAGRIADDLLSSDDAAERAAAVRIAASIAMHDGRAAQAADLFRWLGAHPDPFVSAAGAVVSLAVGDAPGARAALSAESSGPPTSTARAARSLAEGLLLSLEGPYAAAMARLGQSIASAQPAPGAEPDSPAALVTLAALHGGDPVRARSVIGRAVRAGLPEGAEHAGSVARRHRLLLGWVRMQDGQLPAASADVALATADADSEALHRRDALWAAALQTAIARRGGDAGALQKHWYAAMEVLAEYSLDVFSLLPLGELWVAAARLRQVDRLQHTIDEAFALLAGLGDPVLWSVPLHWAGVHAGILANAPDAVAPHGQALTAAAAHSAFAKALATGGRAWLRVLANQVDTDEVTSAARLLAQFGHTWDATRLAGQAALQTPDSRVSQAMLQLARDLKQAVALDDAPGAELPAAPADIDPSTPSYMRLSKKEREVAELLIRGMPYKLIGEQLAISPKTVEHHVARIRRRLGAESRSEMLSMLRAMLTPRS
ncbi:isoniazid response ATPase/transcriptional regulator IniR [Mycobacterium sp. IDR2000157661]|uniref:isoniazid response ATPase/transcriptional regulator IniR n=1 Tax=Mycobacterium sp. IDR2000157661 TaxID=2867005 RepID=UPI001EE9B002|nr:isoniazid response ATPase/transcriptional regulator IniR [Mycobacterium sp. IDR2000157661]ULE34349.1 isoniazid response ATPase/transcriptional regulator IniR [Mycobacterium sp. IDR2000157661]